MKSLKGLHPHLDSRFLSSIAPNHVGPVAKYDGPILKTYPLTQWTGHPQKLYSTIETTLYDDVSGPRGYSEPILTPFFIPQSESAHGCLRVNVLAGTDLETTLGVGQTPFLYAIGLLHKAKRLGTIVGSQEGLLFTIFDIYSRPALYDTINPLDPLLFARATASLDEQRKFYNRVWRLYMHSDRYILVFAIGQRRKLRLVMPDFIYF